MNSLALQCSAEVIPLRRYAVSRLDRLLNESIVVKRTWSRAALDIKPNSIARNITSKDMPGSSASSFACPDAVVACQCLRLRVRNPSDDCCTPLES